MDKNEILARSRAENRGGDPYAREVMTRGYRWGYVAVVLFTMALFLLELILKGAYNFALFIPVCASNAAVYWTNYAKLRRSTDLTAAGLQTAGAALLTAAHLMRLLGI